MILSISIRLVGLGDHSLWIDEAGTASLVETYLNEGIPQYPSGIESNRSKPFMFLVAMSVFLFGLNDFALRLPSALISVLTIFMVFKWSNEVLSYKISLLASTLISLSSWHVAMSQNARMYIMFQFLYFMTFYFLYKYIKRRKMFYLPFILIFMSLSILTHITGYILLFTVPILILVSSDISIKSELIKLIPIVAVAGVIAEIFYFEVSYLFTKLELHPSSAVEHMMWLFTELTFFTLLGFFGLRNMFMKDEDLFYSYIVAIFPPMSIYFFFVDLAASRYLFFILPFLVITSSSFLFRIWQKYGLNSFRSVSIIIVLFLMFLVSSGNPLNNQLGSHSPQPDFKSAYSFVESHSNVSRDEVVLIAGRPLPADHYLMTPDYVLVEKGLRDRIFANGTEFYSGSPTIDSRRDLSRAVGKHETGWVVATDTLERGMNDSLMNEIQKLDMVKSGRDIKVWMWDANYSR